jgi:putative ABC transport system permease protein
MNNLQRIESLGQDLRYGARVLMKSPGFLLVALLSLALGIGATTAIFSVVYGVLISPYPYAKPAGIWAPELRDLENPRQSRGFYRMRDYVEMKRLPAFAEAMATNPGNRLLTGNRAPENFQTIAVTANAFQFLGVAPAWGRTIQPADIKSDGQPDPVIVLTYKAWQRLFDASPAALGRTLTLNDQPFTVIGVMPPRFGWWTGEGGWVAMPEDARDNTNVAPIFRMKRGIGPRVGEQQLQALLTRSAQSHPEEFPKNGFGVKLQNYLDITVASGEMESSLRLLFGAVGFLLLIACANVANLQMARGTARAHEIAVRISVGAARGRLFRQLLTESVLLSTVGGVLGILFAVGLTRGVVALMPENYVPNEARVTVNAWVLMFSAAVSVLTGILFGLAPALQSSRQNLVDSLKDAGRSLASAAGGRTRAALVIAEIALSVVLLMGASLTVRGFVNLQHLDLGFQSDRVLMVSLQLPPKRYPTYDQRIAFAQHVLDSVVNLPGVRSAAIGNGGLPFGGPRSAYSIEGQARKNARDIYVELISADYPHTLGIGLRAGREMTQHEIAHADPVALINETAAKLWPAGVSPIGGRIHVDLLVKPAGALLAPPRSSPDVTVVGVIADTRNDGLRDPTARAAYIPYTLLAPPGRVLALRTETEPMLLLNAVRERIRRIDPDQPLSRPITLEDVVGFETVQPRFNMALFTFFGLLGLALAAAGIYSMLSYSVARRTQEIGIRMALGADRADVLSLMLAMGGKLVLIGLAVGLACSLALAKLLRSEVFQVPGTDPVALTAVVVLLSTAALLACLVPARRASKLDPMTALRHE